LGKIDKISVLLFEYSFGALVEKTFCLLFSKVSFYGWDIFQCTICGSS